MPEPAQLAVVEPLEGYQLGVVQEVLLALLAQEASHGYELRARLTLALGPLAGALNAGQVYVTMNRLERAGLVSSERIGQTDRPDRKVYALTDAGRERVQEWLQRHELAQAGAGRVSPQAWSRRPPPGSRTRSGSSIDSGVSCSSPSVRRSARRSPSRMGRSLRCCSRALC